MSNLQYSYAKEKFEDAIFILSTGQKDVRHRLYDINDCIGHLLETELPFDLLETFRIIKKEIRNFKVYKISSNRSSIEKKLNIRNKTGEKIANQIWHIYHELHFNEKYN